MASLENIWNINKEDAFKYLACSDKGLSTSEAAGRLLKYGANILKPHSKGSVGLTPQLLPAIISVNLSVGARAMAGPRTRILPVQMKKI